MMRLFHLNGSTWYRYSISRFLPNSKDHTRMSGPDSPGSPSQDEMVPEPEPVPKNTPDQFDTHQKLGQIAGTIALLMLTLTLKFKT